MRRSDFHYDLPEALIAQQPAPARGGSRLLVLDRRHGQVSDRRFPDLPALLQPGDLLVLNDTRVVPARLRGRKATGGQVEILIERLLAPDRALAQVRASKTPRADGILLVGTRRLVVEGREGEFFVLRLEAGDFGGLMSDEGHMPLPPYIRRDDAPADRERYQTVYAQRPGAVAAPTAGLHFDAATLARIEAGGVELARLTLHVGAGTFQPVRVEDLQQHRMHSEWLEVDETLCAQVEAARARGGRVVAVGTTSVRALETAASGGVLAPFRGETQLFITPGYDFRVVDALLTNFHLPESTLLMLVCAFGGTAPVLAAYRHAVAARYRFFSYGDAMFVA